MTKPAGEDKDAPTAERARANPKAEPVSTPKECPGPPTANE